jgi:hypothetical protein
VTRQAQALLLAVALMVGGSSRALAQETDGTNRTDGNEEAENGNEEADNGEEAGNTDQDGGFDRLDNGSRALNPSLVAQQEDNGVSRVKLTVEQAGSTVLTTAVPGWVLECDWLEWERPSEHDVLDRADAASRAAVDHSVFALDPEVPWGVVICPSGVDTNGTYAANTFYAWLLEDPPPQVVLDLLVATAYAAVEFPVQVGWSAPFGDEDAPMITQLPTWLWIEPEVWQPRSATTPEVYGITATVTATPVDVEFSSNNDQAVDCGPNLGPPYDFSRAEDDQHSDCTITYHHSSAVGEWDLTSTLTWAITYTCSQHCGPGTLPDYSVVNTRPVRVAELQAVLVTPQS